MDERRDQARRTYLARHEDRLHGAARLKIHARSRTAPFLARCIPHHKEKRKWKSHPKSSSTCRPPNASASSVSSTSRRRRTSITSSSTERSSRARATHTGREGRDGIRRGRGGRSSIRVAASPH